METLAIGLGYATAGATGTLYTSATAASVFSTLGTIGSFASGAMAIGGAASSIFGGSSQAGTMEAYAKQSELNARMETLKGREQALAIKKNLEKDLASQNATFAARGFVSGYGTAQTAEEMSKYAATKDIEAAMFGSGYSAEVSRQQASQYRSEGSTAKIGGYTQALTTLASSRKATSLLDRL